ncbi:2Fe-2S iron-sulfur cluster binding domain-containing protein [Paenibacillus sp. HJL G12]|uniref:2Fe-2S iron-sulfur cluster binding domain-containing protein n=1 Tax=Paenibacillus dendrobii TaxID=2691084 RepID=A0A7X3IIR7_9BACL|nr:2Fe-2S iron-sulfur cluster-binding protein [Paenibacillus dendrobii]MWV44729.1 2Fe-2S iron-sulfur cluster binding domain-containing protein [Paenibacillus dendrobii]
MNHEIIFNPTGKKAVVSHGTSVLAAAHRAGVHIPTRCGGKMGCLMCKVHVDEAAGKRLSRPAESEKRKLGSLIQQGVRLACQSKIEGNLTVSVPEDKLKAAIRKQLEAARQEDEDELW